MGVFLGVSGGLFGGVFCQANFLWSKTFRKYSIIKNHPVFELSLVVLVTALLQFPNPLTREAGDVIIKNLLVDCRHPEGSWVCKLSQLKARGLMDAGLVLVDSSGMLHGYLAQGELDFAINEAGVLVDNEPVDLLDGVISTFVDRTPLVICAKAPLEYAVELFGKLGLRHLIVIEEGSSRVVGVIIKKRLVVFLEGLVH